MKISAMKTKDSTRTKKIFEYAAVVLSGCIFVLLAASWTSPLFRYAYGYDSSWYSLMGRAITRGYVPYRDYFDLKGPVFFMMEAIGQFLLTGRGGIVLIECIAAGSSALILWKTARLRLGPKKSAAVLGCFYFVYFFLLWGGNTCEELMMPFNLGCIYLALKYIGALPEEPERAPAKESEPAAADAPSTADVLEAADAPAATDTPEAADAPAATDSDPYQNYGTAAFLFGVSFAVIVLSKITVAAPMGAAAVTVAVELIRRKRAKLLFPILGLFMLGAAFVAVPVCAYFAMNHAFGRFIYCTFAFAFKRSTDYYEAFSLDWEKNLLICYVVFLFSLFLKPASLKEKHRKDILVFGSLFTFFALHLGTPYTYYFITELPIFVLFLIEFFSMMGEVAGGKASVKRLVWTEAGVMAVLLFYWTPVMDKINENYCLCRYPNSSYYEGTMEVWSFIPEDERDEVYDLESGMIFYEMLGVLPTNPYPVNLPYFLHLDPRIKEEVMEYLKIKRPKWIISEDMESFDDEDVKEYVFSHYELFLDSNAEELYERIE